MFQKMNKKITCIFLVLLTGQKFLMAEDAAAGGTVGPNTRNNQSRNNIQAPNHNEQRANRYGQPPNHPSNRYSYPPSPANHYGPPANHYGPPANHYGPTPNYYRSNSYSYPPNPMYDSKPQYSGKLDLASKLLQVGAQVAGAFGASQGNTTMMQVAQLADAAGKTAGVVNELRNEDGNWMNPTNRSKSTPVNTRWNPQNPHYGEWDAEMQNNNQAYDAAHDQIQNRNQNSSRKNRNQNSSRQNPFPNPQNQGGNIQDRNNPRKERNFSRNQNHPSPTPPEPFTEASRDSSTDSKLLSRCGTEYAGEQRYGTG